MTKLTRPTRMQSIRMQILVHYVTNQMWPSEKCWMFLLLPAALENN